MLVEIILLIIPLSAFVFGWSRWQRRRFEERFPPISDDEFLARCSPGITPAVALRVRRIVAEQTGIEYERIHPSMRFVEDISA